MREFHIDGKRNVLTWIIWIENKVEVHMQHGILEGKLQHTFDIIGSVGKKGTKAFVPPQANAVLDAERKIRKKVEEGYREVNPDTKKPLTKAATKINFKGLPKNLCFMKPRPEPDSGKQLKMRDNVLWHKREIITVKRDGFMHPILIDDIGNIRIYTRRMDEATDKYPHMVASLKKACIPKKTILLCEFIVLNKNGRDDRLAIQAISNSLPERARAMQQAGDKAQAVVLSIPFWDGADMSRLTFGQAIEFLEEQFGLKGRCPDYFEGMEVFYGSFKEAIKYVTEGEREGLVIYDGEASPGDKAWNFRGKPERPECWKWKPVYEDDFLIVFDPDAEHWPKKQCGGWGRGKWKEYPGQVALYQLAQASKSPDEPTSWTFISNCGSGLDETKQKEIMKRAKKRKDGTAGIAEIHYSGRRYLSRDEVSNAVIEPRFIRWRDDKDETEVVNPLL